MVNRIGEEVRIICWDGPDEDYPIVAFDGDALMPSTWGKDGRFLPKRESDLDLFLVTPEPEMTEFEKGLVNFYNERSQLLPDKDGVYNKHDCAELLHKSAKILLELAKKELCVGCIKGTDEYWRGRKEALEEASKGYHYEGPAIPTYFPSCYHGGPCTNPMHDCINCPRQSTVGINTTTGTSTAKVEG